MYWSSVSTHEECVFGSCRPYNSTETKTQYTIAVYDILCSVHYTGWSKNTGYILNAYILDYKNDTEYHIYFLYIPHTHIHIYELLLDNLYTIVLVLLVHFQQRTSNQHIISSNHKFGIA